MRGTSLNLGFDLQSRTVTGGGFTPVDINTVDGINALWVADDVDTGALADWADRKNPWSFIQGTAALQPTVLESGIDSANTVQFADDDAAYDVMTTAAGVGDGHIARNSYTGIVIEFNAQEVHALPQIIRKGGASARWIIRRDQNTGVLDFFVTKSGGTHRWLFTTPLVNNTPYFLELIFDGTQAGTTPVLRINGVNDPVASQPSTATGTPVSDTGEQLYLMNSAAGDRGVRGEIGTIIFGDYDTLTGDGETTIQNWVKAQYRIPINVTDADRFNVVFMGQSQTDQLFVSRDGGGNGGQIAFQNELLAISSALDVDAIDAAVGGVAMSTSADTGSGAWWNVSTDQPTALLQSTITTAINAMTGPADCIVIQAGPADAINMDVVDGTTQAEYVDSFQKVISYARTQFGNANLPVLLIDIPRNETFANEPGGQIVREAHAIIVAADPNMQFGADIYDAPLVDGTHATDAGCVIIGERWAASVASLVFGVNGIVGIGPRASAAAIQSQTEIDVTITYPDGGDDFTAGNDSFYVTNGGTPISITSVTRVNSTTARITLGANLNLGETTLVYPVYDRLEYLTPGAISVITGNDPNNLPLQTLPVLEAI